MLCIKCNLSSYGLQLHIRFIFFLSDNVEHRLWLQVIRDENLPWRNMSRLLQKLVAACLQQVTDNVLRAVCVEVSKQKDSNKCQVNRFESC